jgi:hypothetical protein
MIRELGITMECIARLQVGRCAIVGLLASLAPGGSACGHSNEAEPRDATVDTAVADGAPLDAPRGDIDAAIDGGSDAGIDASAGPAFDVAYVDEIHVSSDIASFRGLILVINKGPGAISLDAITIVSFVDDTPLAEWVFTKRLDASIKLPPDQAAGDLTPASAAKIVDSGLVREPIGDRTLDFEFSFVFPPPPGIKFRGRAVLQIEDQRVILPFQFFITRDGAVETISAARVSSGSTR